MNIKKIFSVLFALLLIISAAAPVAALPKSAAQNTDYIEKTSAVIGSMGYPLTVQADGSFYISEEDGSLPSIFGFTSPEAEVSFLEKPYPVSTHTYSKNGLDLTLEQFVLDSEKAVIVFSRLTVKNTTDVSQAFPEVRGTSPITAVPEEIPAKGNATVDFAAVLAYHGYYYTSSSIIGNDYDSAKEEMKAFWDAFLSDKLLCSALSDGHSAAIKEYKTALVSSAVSGVASPAVPLGAPELLSDMSVKDVYTAALALQKTGDTAAAIAYLSTSDFDAALLLSYGGETLPFATLSENLDALLSLQSYAYILKTLSVTDPALSQRAEEAKACALSLSENIATAISDVQDGFECDWETVTTGASDGIVLNGEGFASAVSLCDWYAKCAPFTLPLSKELITLAKDGIDYYYATDDYAASILSLFTEREDGTILIGHGAPYSLLSENKTLKLENLPLSNQSAATLEIKADEKEITVKLSGSLFAPVQIEFPALAGYIEYASVGYDSDSGIVTAPEGTSIIDIRLIRKLANIEKERFADSTLELALSEAAVKNIESATSVSEKLFSEALLDARRAKTATNAKKLECAEALRAATAKLSPMTAGYSYSLPTNEKNHGSLTKNEILQKFTLPADGTVKSVTVLGEYANDIYAAVYTIRGDNYTTDELCAEAAGKKVDGGFKFDLDFKALGNTVYILCIFSESENVTLSLEGSDGENPYTRERGEITVYSGTSLCAEFSVTQVDRSDLDTFYSTCLETDISEYTKSSRKTLKNKMAKAEELLCTPSVTESEYEKVYTELKDAFDGLETYASKDKIEKAPVISIVLIVTVVVLLGGTLISALSARRRFNMDDEEE